MTSMDALIPVPRTDPGPSPAVAGARRYGTSVRAFLLSAAKRFGGFAVLIGIWSLISWYLSSIHQPDWVLPQPGRVLGQTAGAISTGVLPTYTAASVLHLLLAGTTGLIVGVAVGVLIGLSTIASKLLYPLINFFQSLGGIAVAPLIIVWFGFSTTGLVVAINYSIFFPIVFSTLTGVRTVPPVYTDAARTMGANQFQVIRDVIIPGAMPNILLGARLAFAYGWRAVIGIEMLFSISGIGYWIFDAQQFLDTPTIIYGMICLGVVWMLFDETVLKPIEALTIRKWGMVHR
jgi:taurine transport system permease protein